MPVTATVYEDLPRTPAMRLGTLGVCLIVCGGLLSAGKANAAGLDLSYLPNDTRWVLHLDIDALKEAELTRTVLLRVWERDPSHREIRNVATLFGIDLSEDLHSVTFLGRNFDPDDGAVLAHVELEQKRVLALFQLRDDYRAETYREHTIHIWNDDNSSRRVYGVFLDDDRIVFGHDRDTVKAVLDVVAGAAPSWTRSSPDDNLAVPPGTIVHLWFEKVGGVRLPFMSPLIRRIQHATLMIGESGQEVFVEGTVRLDSASIAVDLRDALVGIIALGKLQFADEADVTALLNLARVTVSGNLVTGTWRAPRQTVGELLMERFGEVAAPKADEAK
ncbi:hypothetical protein JCM19992_24250 [Thermostilla marina]